MEELVLQAIQYACEKQKSGLIKDNAEVKMTHALEVLNILMSEGYPSHVLIAGLLHEIVEDTKEIDLEIRQRFGNDVSRILPFVREDKGLESYDRKMQYLSQLMFKWDDSIGAVAFADHLSQLRRIYRDDKSLDLYIDDEEFPIELAVQYYQTFMHVCWRLIDRPMFYEYERMLFLIKEKYNQSSTEIDRQLVQTFKEWIEIESEAEPTDYKQLFALYKHLADRFDDDEAQLALGMMYQDGKVVKRDINEAMRYFSYASNHGNPDAYIYYGNLILSTGTWKHRFEYVRYLFDEAKQRGSEYADQAMKQLELHKAGKGAKFVTVVIDQGLETLDEQEGA